MKKKMSKGIQCRVQNSDYHLHVQAIGPIETNRPYGGAGELRAPTEVIEWCNEQTPVYCSAASGKVYYVQMQVLMFDTGKQALLIHGEEFNHPKGMMMGCNPKSPAVKAVVEYAYQTDMMTDAVFDDKVSEITLAQSPMVMEGVEPSDTEKEFIAGHQASHDAMMEDFAKMVETALSDEVIEEASCKECGLPHLSQTLVCQGCESPVCDGCYFTPQDCELCGEETHGGAVVWCNACAGDMEGFHLAEDCEEYCTEDGCLMAKPCNCTQVLEEE